MRKLTEHIAFKQVAILLIAGGLLCVLFGDGAHLHAAFDYIFDHGNVHTIVHAHPADEATTSAFHGEDGHHHHVASVDLNGVRSQSGKYKVTLKSISIVFPSVVNLVSLWNNHPPILFDLPPPERAFSQYHFFSFSLRAPPLA